MEFPLLNKDMQAEFDLRVKKIREQMKKEGCDAVIAASTANIFYTTGGVFRGYVYINSSDATLVLMTPPAECASEICASVRKPEQIPDILASKGIPEPKRLGLEMDDLYYSEVTRLSRIWPDAELLNASNVFRRARLVKTDHELKMMREDGNRQTAVYSKVRHLYREGMTDVELQIETERMLRREGCLGFLRTAGNRMEINLGSVLAGPNADAPSPYDFSMGGAGTDPSLPVGADGTILRPGMSVMLDMNGGFNGYQTDMTRVWTVGEVSPLARRAHECSIAILHDLEKYALPGREIGELYRRAHRLADAAGLLDYFMGHSHKVKFIGHGVGIELNEGPVVMERNKERLEAGMALALEPKFVIPEVGALGVENTYIVTETGLENITPLEENLMEF